MGRLFLSAQTTCALLLGAGLLLRARCKHEFERAAERIRMQEAARAGALFTHGKVRWGLA